ncbi:hypothetical protein [Polaribacter sp. NJDZ03]|uniref:hypothetical protein n=1 Tax=Polaribacter sp. NJDZ03 TaxID=2855841 RepID=UPI001C4A3F5F|nr:hypothetical protein [Polaribacter sp. NJDZ03]
MKKIFLVILFLPFICFSQKVKDTLFIKLDGKYLKKGFDYTEKEHIFVFKDNDNSAEFTSLSITDTLYNLKPTKIYCMNTIIKKSGAYYDNDKVRDYDLAIYLNKHIVIIIEKKHFTKTVAITEIE